MVALMVINSISGSVQAASGTWGVIKEGTYSWQDCANWAAGSIPGSGINDAASFTRDFTGNQIVALDRTVTLGTLNFSNTTGTVVLAGGAGGTMSFNAGGAAAINKTGPSTAVIQANMGLQNQVSLNVAQGVLVLDGAIDGANGFTKNGPGTVILRRTNTYTGQNILNEGMVWINPASNDLGVLGATNPIQNTIVNDGASLVINNDASNTAGDTTGGTSMNSEAITIYGQGFRNLGALRSILGRESNQFTGPITLGSSSRVQSDLNTLTLTGPVITNDNTLMMGGPGFTSITGPVSGSGDIIHYGISGFRMQNVTAAQTFSGAIYSQLGEIRADVSDATTGNNPYANVSAFNLRNSYLNLVASGTASVVQNRVDDDIPITLQSGRLRLESASFNNTSATQNAVNWNEVLGNVTLASGHNYIDFRDTLNNTVQRSITVNDLVRNPGTMLQLGGDGTAATTIGTNTQYRVMNNALTGGGMFLSSAGGPTTTPSF